MIKTISCGVKAKVLWHEDTELWVIDSKKYNIVGFGKTYKKAKIMFKEKVNEKLIK